MAKKFKRYFTGSENHAGKGDDRRDAQVDPKTAAKNWCETFGHKPENHTGAFCTNCGTCLHKHVSFQIVPGDDSWYRDCACADCGARWTEPEPEGT